MNIEQLFACLDDNEKNKLSEICLNYLNVSKAENLITVEYAIEKYDVDTRLKNALLINYGSDYLIQTIRHADLLKCRDTGWKTLEHFKELKDKIRKENR